ncbi:MAG: hypothetical protein B6242_04600 [Anaerolineaceae bacterium 4572_78]|nr:MAG: hypothetical protein B6242_04600 [Anaerolineaceae bacterium 4572_78]
MTLSQLYHINEENLALRREFIHLNKEEIKILKNLAKWAERWAKPIVHELHDFIFNEFPTTRSFLETHANKTHRLPNELRQHLDENQIEYFKDIFNEAARDGNFGVEYYENRIKLGYANDIADLPLKWYLGCYSHYKDLVRKYLFRSYFYRPFFRAKAERAIFLAFDYDIQIITDVVFNNFLRSLGIRLASYQVSDQQHDIADIYGTIQESLREAILETQQTSDLLAKAGDELVGATSQVGEDISQIVHIIQQVSEGSMHQANTIGGTADAIENMSQAIDGVARGAQEQAAAVGKSAIITAEISYVIKKVADNAQASANAAAQAADIAQSGADMVEATVDGMQAIRDKVELSAQKVREMGERSEQIGTIVKTIEAIATQTNLLALNASIEAARAGEYGKGFAVVADEVGKLAEKSTDATKEIADLVSSIQETVDEAVVAMDEGAREVETGVSQANESGRSLASILRSTNDVNDQVRQISAAAQEMNDLSNQLVDAMDTVSAVVEQNAAHIPLMILQPLANKITWQSKK